MNGVDQADQAITKLLSSPGEHADNPQPRRSWGHESRVLGCEWAFDDVVTGGAS